MQRCHCPLGGNLPSSRAEYFGENKLLPSAASVMCHKGYRKYGGPYVSPRRGMDLESKMGERRCNVDATEGLVLTSRHITERVRL